MPARDFPHWSPFEKVLVLAILPNKFLIDHSCSVKVAHWPRFIFIDLDYVSVNNNTKKPIYSHLDLRLGQL